MSDQRLEDGFSPESLGEDLQDEARSQLAVLEKALESCREPSQTAALMDEAYRAAHTLRAAVDSRSMPNVDRLARRLMDVVRAARSGSLVVTLELGAVISSIARVARDALGQEAAAEPLSASSAGATLEEILEHPGAWSAPPGLAGRRFEWARVEAGRLSAATDAAKAARAAFSAYRQAAEESVGVVERFRAGLVAHHQAVDRLREVIPRAMAAAARGEQTASAAAELAESLAVVGSLGEGLEAPLSRSGDAVREAAVQGGRAADRAEAAFSSLTSVRLDALLGDLPRAVQRVSRAAGARVELVQEPTNVEVIAARSEAVVSLVTRCVRAAVGALRARTAHGRGARLTLFARAAGDSLYLRLALVGAAPDPRMLRDALSAVQKRLQREGAGLEAEARKGESASILLTIRSAAAITSRTAEFVFARAGEAWYGIPASSVVECVDGGLSMSEYILEGEHIPTLRMNDTRDPRQAVVVKTPRGGAVLLFDAIGTREMGLQTSGTGEAPRIAGIAGSVRRPDGSAARLLDLTVLLPSPH